MLFDSHTHLNDQKFDEDREQVIMGAYDSGVTLMMIPGADLESSKSAVELARQYPFLYAAVGIHPHDTHSMDDISLQLIKSLSRNDKVMAIGEIGLDYYYDHSPRDVQKHWFRQQLALAKELDLPVIIHDRDAHQDVLDIIDEVDNYATGVIMHCFSGSKELAKVYLNRGAYISLGGPVTFKNARKSIEVAEMVPMDRLLIETDSPYLAPTPNRGKRNESTYVKFVAQRIAEIRGFEYEYVAQKTFENAKRIFKIG
jgi:TatD DNase family protein